jgi:hypothetical protein
VTYWQGLGVDCCMSILHLYVNWVLILFGLIPISRSKNLKIMIYRTMILPVVLYGCETWSLILTEERRLRVFENTVLRRVFGPKRDEVT